MFYVKNLFPVNLPIDILNLPFLSKKPSDTTLKPWNRFQLPEIVDWVGAENKLLYQK